MPTQAEADMAWRRYGQWTSYVLQLRENLERAERLLPLSPTPMARALNEKVIATCTSHLADMERLFPDA